MTRHDIAPLLIASLLSLVACGGEVAPDAAVGERPPDAEAHEAEAPVMPAPPDGVALRVEDEAFVERIRVSDGEARFIARREVPEGRLISAALSEQDGRLVYSYELEVEGRPGLVRVMVDAVNARVVAGGGDGRDA